MSRFFVTTDNVFDDCIRITDKQDIQHIVKVLRLKEGDKIDVSDSLKWEYQTEISTIDKDYVDTVIIDRQSFANEPFTKVSLFQGIPKAGKMELIIQKCVELGLYELVPVFTDRTIVTDNGKLSKKIERWQKISDEAVKQCKRGIIPEIRRDITFKEMINSIDKFELVLFPYENEENITMRDVLHDIRLKCDSKRCLDAVKMNVPGLKQYCMPETVAIIIGPEGGFSDSEAEQLKTAGAKCVTLGKTTLRTETAGMAALSMVMYEFEL